MLGTSMARETGPQMDEQLVRLTNELLDRWTPVLQGKDWAKRLGLLGQIHEQLQEDIKDLETYCAVSPMFIAGLIERLGTGEVDSVEQAHIYSNSGNETHRHMAGLWLARHQGMN
jgi:hypothetical protein